MEKTPKELENKCGKVNSKVTEKNPKIINLDNEYIFKKKKYILTTEKKDH